MADSIDKLVIDPGSSVAVGKRIYSRVDPILKRRAGPNTAQYTSIGSKEEIRRRELQLDSNERGASTPVNYRDGPGSPGIYKTGRWFHYTRSSKPTGPPKHRRTA